LCHDLLRFSLRSGDLLLLSHTIKTTNHCFILKFSFSSAKLLFSYSSLFSLFSTNHYLLYILHSSSPLLNNQCELVSMDERIGLYMLYVFVVWGIFENSLLKEEFQSTERCFILIILHLIYTPLSLIKINTLHCFEKIYFI
jgi:hypothetical protein